MPRSSRHKSSKHSREYSDSEKDKEKKDVGGSGRHSKEKDSTSSEKRKLDSKAVDMIKETIGLSNDVGNEYGSGIGGGGAGGGSSSRKRKEKMDEDRWTGGGGENSVSMSEVEVVKGEGKEKEKEKESKRSSRREESGEEGKKSGGKVEGKHHHHHRSEKKEREEKEERKGSSRSGDKLVDIVSASENVGSDGSKKQGSGGAEERSAKHGVGITEGIQEEFRKPELERDPDRRVRRKKDVSGDGDRHQDSVREPDERRLSSREEIAKPGKYKDDGHKDAKYRDKHPEDVEKDYWHQDEKQRVSRTGREYTAGISDAKHLRNDKKESDLSQKKSKPHGSDYDRELDRDKEREHDHGREKGKDRDRSRHEPDRDRDRDHDNREHERDAEHVNDREPEDKDRVRDRYRHEHRDRGRDRDPDRGRAINHDHDYGSHADDKASRYKDDRGRRRSPDGYDDYYGDKSKRSEPEAGKERSVSRKPYVDSVASNSRRRTSPGSRSYGVVDKYRDGTQEESRCGEPLRDNTMSDAFEKVPKYRVGDKRGKFDDNHVGEFSERSPRAKTSPARLKERSPSSTSFDRRFPSRNSRRRSLDVEEAERRSSGSNEIRDVSGIDDRQGREFSAKKSMGEEYPPAESPFYHKSGQGNISSHGPGPGSSSFRSGADSPSFTGSLGEDSRVHPGSRYRRSVDPHLGRGPGNAWKGVPNWSSPMHNGFMPFPPGPPGPHHGGFPPILSQYPPLFGVRPSLEMNHPGMPYHMAEGDRFSGHVRPMGWPNMVDGSVPPHFHGWDPSNGVLRDEPSMYGPGHLASVQRREINPEMWNPNGDANMDGISGSQKNGQMIKGSTDEASSGQGSLRQNLDNTFEDQGASFKKDTSSGLSPTKEITMAPVKMNVEKTPESASADDNVHPLRAYLAELDISMDLADRELYNQWINLAAKGQSGCIEPEVELGLTEEKEVAESEITDVTVGVKFLPAAKDSIFQRAMYLYKTLRTERGSAVLPDDEKMGSPPSPQPGEEPTLMLLDNTDIPADHIVKKEELSPLGLEEMPIMDEGEGKELVCVTSDDAASGEPLQSSESAQNGGDESLMPVLDVEKMEEDIPVALPLENVEGQLLVESTNPDVIDSNAADGDTVVGKTCSNEPAPCEQVDMAVSGPLDVSHDSVKVCEALISVSNESESVILSRIHHAPESTH